MKTTRTIGHPSLAKLQLPCLRMMLKAKPQNRRCECEAKIDGLAAFVHKGDHRVPQVASIGHRFNLQEPENDGHR